MTHKPNPAAGKWVGDVVLRYDQKRAERAVLIEDSRIVDAFLETCEPGSAVADIPAGTGKAARSILNRGLHYIGVDISADMIAVCQEKIAGDPNARALVADARSTSLPDGAVDYLVSVKLIKWLPTDQMVLDALKEFRRICRKQALVSVKMLRADKPKRSLRSHIEYAIKTRSLVPRPRSSSIAPSAFETLCAQADWKVVKTIDNPLVPGGRFYLLDAV